jgi:hypothetical protein
MITYTIREDIGVDLACFEHNDVKYEIPVTNKDETERQELFLEQIEIMEDIINLQ